MGVACKPGCTCKRHSNGGRKCQPGCDCGLHQPRDRSAMHEGLRKAMEEGRWKGATYKDGRTAHPHHSRWDAMVRRCNSPGSPSYKWYGARGIRVHDAWRDDPWSFYNYLDEKLGPCPPGWSLDRINVNGDYCPGNVRWADRIVQRDNQRKPLQLTHPESNVWVIS